MKKSNFIQILVLSIFMISCRDENNEKIDNTPKTELTQKNAAFAKLSASEQQEFVDKFIESLSHNNDSDKGPKGFCHPFKVKVKVLGVEIETTVNVCCTTLTMNCTPIPDVVINKNAGDVLIETVEVVDSSVYVNDEGESIKIKEGMYDVSSGSVQFELIKVK